MNLLSSDAHSLAYNIQILPGSQKNYESAFEIVRVFSKIVFFIHVRKGVLNAKESRVTFEISIKNICENSKHDLFSRDKKVMYSQVNIDVHTM